MGTKTLASVIKSHVKIDYGKWALIPIYSSRHELMVVLSPGLPFSNLHGPSVLLGSLA